MPWLCVDTAGFGVLAGFLPMESGKTASLYERASARIPGGVNSPVRSWSAVGGLPRFIASGLGARVIDCEGMSYLDYVGSWGPLILGHADSRVVRAVQGAVARGMTFGAPTDVEVTLAEMIADRVPSVEKVRLVSSGTEAAMSAIRLARAYTRRDWIIKFDGCYHGHADAFLARAGSGVATLSIPGSAGVPSSVTGETIVLSYNSVEEVEAAFRKCGDRVAAVIVEPVCGNMGVIPPESKFLETLRALTKQYGAVLIFDEVITGFRVARGGAQELYDILPDLTCLGKILGGGLPLAAFGGKAEIMGLLAPDGPVYQAGTLSGNPVAVTAGIATLAALDGNQTYAALEKTASSLQQALESVLRKHKIAGTVNRVGSMLTLFFGARSVANAADARGCDGERFGRFFHGMINRGIYFPPSPFETAFVSLAHTQADIEETATSFEDWARTDEPG